MAAPTTSGSTGYTQTCYKIICSALRIVSVIADDEIPSSSMTDSAMDSLNAMVLGWQADGIHVWTQEEALLFLAPGQAQYQLGSGTPDKACLYDDFVQTAISTTAAAGASAITVASISGLASGDTIGVQVTGGVNFWTTISGTPSGHTVTLASPLSASAVSGALVFSYGTPLLRPLRVPAGRRFQYSSQLQTPLIVMSRLDYDYLPNLYTTGSVTQFFYDPQTGNGAYATPMGKMNVWPAPADNSFGMRFVSLRPLQAFQTLANVPDFPPEWLAAIKWNLAVEIGPEYSIPDDLYAIVKNRADEWFSRAKQWDREPEPIFFGMAMQPGYR